MSILWEKYRFAVWIVAGLAVLGYIQWQRHDAASGAAAECKADVLALEVADLKAKLVQAQAAAAAQQFRADATQQQLEKAESDSASLKTEINRVGNGGNIPASVRQQLRGILGK